MSPASPHSHHVLVDFENVPSVDLSLIEDLPVLVTLLIGRTQTKLDTTLVEQIHAHATKVRLITLSASGRNALDLTLAYYLGRAVVEQDGAEQHIVSRDKDFEPLIAHLRSKNVNVVRSESFAELPFLPTAKSAAVARKTTAAPRKSTLPATIASEDRRARVIARLRNPANRHRPSSERALRAHVRTALGKEGSDEKVEEILRELHQAGVLTIEPKGKVVYAPQ
jgi:hypothetical protein